MKILGSIYIIRHSSTEMWMSGDCLSPDRLSKYIIEAKIYYRLKDAELFLQKIAVAFSNGWSTIDSSECEIVEIFLGEKINE